MSGNNMKGKGWCILIMFDCGFCRGHGKDGRPDCSLMEFRKQTGSKYTVCLKIEMIPEHLMKYMPSSDILEPDAQGSLL